MIFPLPLKKGSTIGLICPSSAIRPEQKDACLHVLAEMGFRVKAAPNLTDNYAGYMAGPGSVRGEWLTRMFADPEVDAVFCARGGDASGRVVSYLDLDVIRRNPKPFVGYSDITTFNLILNQMCGLGTFHGPMVSSNMIDGMDEYTRNSFFDCLTAPSVFEFTNPEGDELQVLHEGHASGIVTGGNLALLSGSMGTPYEVDTKGKIFFLEEVHESGPRLERLVWQMKNAGKFDDCAGILLGQFLECENTQMPEYDSVACFRDALEGLDKPVLYNVCCGHGARTGTIPLGAMCEMDTASKRIRFTMNRIR